MVNLEYMERYKLCVETCMELKPGENVLILTDPENMDKAEGLAIASHSVGAEPFILCQISLKKFTVEPARLISESMKRAEVILVCFPFFYQALLFHTQARKEASKNGARFGGIWLNAENMNITKEEIVKTKELTEKIGTFLTNAETARVTTINGTEVTMDVKGRNSVVLSSIPLCATMNETLPT
jgi:leucyl aminopeptidase (aminopeptidase T)